MGETCTGGFCFCVVRRRLVEDISVAERRRPYGQSGQDLVGHCSVLDVPMLLRVNCAKSAVGVVIVTENISRCVESAGNRDHRGG